MPTFMEKLSIKWGQGKFLCIGLDSDINKLPNIPEISVSGAAGRQIVFNGQIIEATARKAGAYKLNAGFYEGEGVRGFHSLQETIAAINDRDDSIPIILDAKRGDIDSTNGGYVKMAFRFMRADAITIAPYLGMEANKPFLDQADKGVIVLCRTSNRGSGEFQDREVVITGEEAEQWGLRPDTRMPLYQYVAWHVSRNWNYNRNCALVVGATFPEELRIVREIVGDMPILIPGVGAQGGDLEASVRNGVNSQKKGIIINCSRSIIFASSESDYRIAAGDEADKVDREIRAVILALTA